MQKLREFIRLCLFEKAKVKKSLLTEPDSPKEGVDETELEKEASVAAGVAGATVPLGAGPTYPQKLSLIHI